MIKIVKVAAIWLFFISTPSLAAQNCTPSWCANTQLGEAENRICQNTALSTVDVLIDAIYQEVKQMEPAAEAKQQEWLNKRNQLLDTRSILGSYADRLEALYFDLYTTPSPAPNCAPFWCSEDSLNRVETKICQNATLSAVDVLMGAVYRQLINSPMPGFRKREVRDNQRNWLDERNRLQTVNDLLATYLEKTRQLLVQLNQLNLSSTAWLKTCEKCWIVTASQVRARSAPNTSAAVVAKLNFGTIVKELSKSASPVRIGTTTAHWYQISLQNGPTGWIFGSLLTAFKPSAKAETFRDIARQRLANPKYHFDGGIPVNKRLQDDIFDELTDLFVFLDRVSGEVPQTTEIAAELKLMRLQTLQRAGNAAWGNWDKPPYKAWLHSQKELGNMYYVDYGQIGWFVEPNKFWALSQQYRNLPIGEEIAWQAANLALGGECEGFIGCYLHISNLTSGQYLARYPNGQHVKAAFKDAVGWITSDMDIINGGEDFMGIGDDKAEQNSFIEKLRPLCQTLKSVNHPNQAFVLGELDKWFKQLGSSDKCR